MQRRRSASLAVAFWVGTAGLFLVAGTVSSGQAVAAEADTAIADAGLITLADLPRGFRPAIQGASNAQLNEAAEQLPACRALAAVIDEPTTTTKKKPKRKGQSKAPIAHADGDPFESSSGDVTSSVSVFANTAAATAAERALQNPSMERCLEDAVGLAMQSFATAAAQSLPPGQRDAAQQFEIAVDKVAGPTDGSMTYRIVVNNDVLLSGIPRVIDLVFARVGRAIATYQFSSLGTPPTTADSLLPPVLERLTTAQA